MINLSFLIVEVIVCNELYNFIMTENPEKSGKSRAQLHDLESHSIYSNQLNNSTSKMLYSLAKQPRFKDQKTTKQYRFYELPSMLSKRSASFGYGNKSDLSKSVTNGPPPDAYKIEGQFEKRRSNAIAIGLGRQLVRANSLFGPKNPGQPGPASYNPHEIPSHQKVSIAGRTVDHSDKWQLEIPGPGAYKTLQLVNKQLRSPISNIPNCKTGKFSLGEQRGDFQKKLIKANIPGPGKYSTMQAAQIVGRFPRQAARSFGKSSRPSIANASFAPGPGAYNHLSEFIN